MLGIGHSGNGSPITRCRTETGKGRLRLGLGRLVVAAPPEMCPGSQNRPEKRQKATWDRLSPQQVMAAVPTGYSVPFAQTVVWYRAVPCRSMSSALGGVGPSAGGSAVSPRDDTVSELSKLLVLSAP